MATIAEARLKTRKDVLKLTIGVGDEELTVSILPPTKAMYEDMTALCGVLARVASGEDECADLGDLLSVVANVMSNNTSLTRVSAERLEAEGFDVVDVLEFANAFACFVKELAKPKN